MSKICPNCGNELKDDQFFCTNCGEKFEESQPKKTSNGINSDYIKSRINSVDYSVAKESIDGLANSALEGAKGIANKVNQSIQDNQAREREKLKQYEGIDIDIDYYLTHLWTWLKKDSKKEHFYNETELVLNEKQFINAVQSKLDDNFVPARIVKKNILWDNENDQGNYQVRYCIESTDNNVVNPYTCLLNFNKVGKFTFVEENTFITPPKINKIPGKKVTVPDSGINTLLIGLVLFIGGVALNGGDGAGAVGALVLIVGAIIFIYGLFKMSERKSAIAHNEQVDKDIAEWNRIWTEWENKSLLCSFQEDTSGRLSRVFDAVYDSVKQVSAELIKGKVVNAEVEKNDLNDLEQLVSRRREEYR